MHIYTSPGIIVYFGDQEQGISLHELSANIVRQQINALVSPEDVDLPFFFTRQTHGVHGIAVALQIVDSVQSFTIEADFMTSDHRGIGLGVLTADCIPLILYDRAHHTFAIVHAGWRGSVLGIFKNALAMMIDRYATDPALLELIIGPAARSCCYEVGQDVVRAVCAFSWANQVIVTRNDRFYVDMVMFNVCWAQNLGIRTTSISIDNAECTICTLRYCSYRRQGALAKRQISIVYLMY